MKLNSRQKDVVRQYLLSNRCITVNASAGTGKSTLLQAISHKLKHPGNHIFLAFTKAAQGVMQTKMPRANIKTTYSVGMSALMKAYGKLNVNKFKLANNYQTLIEQYDFDLKYLSKVGKPYPDRDGYLAKDVYKIVTKSLLNCVVSEYEIQEVAAQESFKVLEQDTAEMTWACIIAYELIRLGHKQMVDDKVIDFNEMIAWAAMLPEVQPSVYQELFVDEAQDLSIAQIYLIEKMAAEDCQAVFVGDTYQSIYSFSGASGKSLKQLTESFNCIEMPLTVNYRCGRKIIEYAQEIDPQIEAYDGAPDGQILDMDDFDATEYAISNPGETWFLCRVNSHLIRLGLGLMSSGVKFKYQRNVLEDRLLGVVGHFEYTHDSQSQARQNWGNFVPWINKQISVAKEKRNIDRMDILECVQVLFNKYRSDSPAKFKTAIKRFFKAHSSKSKITLSTIHAAKGYEADTVIFWGTELVPHSMAASPVEIEQERNLDHIVRTRAINNLVRVDLGTADSE